MDNLIRKRKGFLLYPGSRTLKQHQQYSKQISTIIFREFLQSYAISSCFAWSWVSGIMNPLASWLERVLEILTVSTESCLSDIRSLYLRSILWSVNSLKYLVQSFSTVSETMLLCWRCELWLAADCRAFTEASM